MKFRKRFLQVLVCGVMAVPFAAAEAHTIELTGVVRDFKRGDLSGGHPDFETAGSMQRFGHVLGLVTMTLGEDGKPVYNPVRPEKDTIQSAESFHSWYRDVPDVNLSEPLRLKLSNGQSEPGGIYTYSSNSFFPIDGRMFGNQGLSNNYHFTFELKTKFNYVPGQYFTFIGDDDVWVYINGTRVIDLGGVHAALTGSVLFLDGKAFVEKAHFPNSTTEGMVQTVDKQMANHLSKQWSDLGLSGSSPIKEGDRYIDLNLNRGDADIRCEFNDTSVTCFASKDLSNVVLLFEDGTEQKFDDLKVGRSHTFTGSGANSGKTIRGVWVKVGPNHSYDGPGQGQYFTPAGLNEDITLDFYFAERHTTQSNFRIDTSISLTEVEPTTISPLYD